MECPCGSDGLSLVRYDPAQRSQATRRNRKSQCGEVRCRVRRTVHRTIGRIQGLHGKPRLSIGVRQPTKHAGIDRYVQSGFKRPECRLAYRRRNARMPQRLRQSRNPRLRRDLQECGCHGNDDARVRDPLTRVARMSGSSAGLSVVARRAKPGGRRRKQHAGDKGCGKDARFNRNQRL